MHLILYLRPPVLQDRTLHSILLYSFPCSFILNVLFAMFSVGSRNYVREHVYAWVFPTFLHL